MLNRADRVVAQSRNTRNNAVKYYGIKRQIDIISLGIKKPQYIKKNRSHFNLDENTFVLSTICRLVKRKNIPDALTALARIRNSVNFTFLIIGDGPERKTIEDMIRRLDLSSNIRLLGNVSDEEKFQILDLSDAYLSTSLHEGFGLVFLEAMACGLPIICHNNGGQTDFLVDGRTGFLTDVGDIETFVQRIMKIFKNKALRTQIGNYNKNMVSEFYISRCAEKYLYLFQELIEQRANKGSRVN
jgi:glycosyltransferase involved in cell wall biosynthesis